MEGRIVEYIDAQKIATAICLKERGESLRLLVVQNREINLNKNRVYLVSKEKYCLDQSRESLITILKEEIARREDLKDKIDVVALWELLVEDGGVYLPSILCDYYFLGPPSSIQESAIFRALYAEKIHFKLKGNRLEVQSQKKVEEHLRQEVEKREREKNNEELARWLEELWLGKSVSPPQDSKKCIEFLKEWCFWEEEAPHAKITKDILHRAGLKGKDHPFLLLVKLGVFSKHENVLLYRFGVPTSFSKKIKEATQILIKNKPQFCYGRKDLRSLYTFSIDGPETKDFDDALTFSQNQNSYIVGVHITDLTPFIQRSSPLDEEAKQRGMTLYLPDQRLPMFPESISENLASLKKGEKRAALSFFITLDENSNILKYELLPSIIKVDRHFSYDEVNNLLDKEQALQTMFELALRFRAWRLDRGGMVISLPELVFSFEEGNLVDIRQQKADQPSRILVAEFMIMANYLAAKFMEEKGIAAIYRSQPPPRGRVMNGISNDIFILYLQRKLLNSSKFDIKPTFHHILGLQGYSSVTSPLRRYLDLVMQRQIVFFLQKGKPLYTKDELSHLIPYFDQIISRTNMISAQQVRYWVLHYLEQYIKNIVEAYILEETPRGYRLLLRDYLMEANLIDPKARFAQGEKVKVKIKVVNPHKDILKVTLQ